MDWILSRLRLVDTEDENEETESDVIPFEKSRLEIAPWKKEKAQEEHRVFFKNVQSYEECKMVIDNYKSGAVCIYGLNPVMNPEAQGMMNYICGGIYALGGDVMSVGKNIFMTDS